MKKTILTVVAAAVCSVEAAVMYRGRLVDAEHPNAGARVLSGSKQMTFRFYDDSGLQQGEPLVRNVPLETNGMFTVFLDSPELSEALRQGKAVQVGLTVGDAANEIRPLRKLLPTVRAVQADAASGLSRGAKVDQMTAKSVEAEKLAVGGSLTVGGTIKPADKGFKSELALIYNVKIGEGSKLRAKDGSIVVLGEPELLTPNLAQGCPGVAAGDTIKDQNGKLVVAPAAGVATISCVESLKQSEVNGETWNVQDRGKYYASAFSPCCSVVQFCEKGEEIKVPAGWSWRPWNGEGKKMRFTVRFHPFVKQMD